MTKDINIEHAIIYCRFVRTNQSRDDDELRSQEARCQTFSAVRGYRVAKVFTDRSSGVLIERPGLNALLAFLHITNEPHAVIIDDLSRLARSAPVFMKLRIAIESAGGRLESPSFELGQSSESRLLESVLANFVEHQSQER